MNGAATGKKRRLKKRHGWWIWIVLGALLVAAAMAGGVILETNRINFTASNAIEMIRDICLRYDSYRLGERVDDLQALINKANILSIYTENVDLSREEVLARYARNQYLSGIIVLDDSLNVVGSLDLAGERRDSFLSFICNDEARPSPACAISTATSPPTPTRATPARTHILTTRAHPARRKAPPSGSTICSTTPPAATRPTCASNRSTVRPKRR